MEKPFDSHLLNMRLTILLTVLILFSILSFKSSYAQPTVEFAELNEKLNERMNTLEMGRPSGRYFFYLDSIHEFSFREDEGSSNKWTYSRFKEPFLDFLREHKESFTTVGWYSVYVYYDRFYRQFYTNFTRVNSSPNEYDAGLHYLDSYPKSGSRTFFAAVKKDLIANYDSLIVNPDDWRQPLEVIVSYVPNPEHNKRGQQIMRFDDKNSLSKFMDRSKEIDWYVAIYNGKPTTSIFSFWMDKEDFMESETLQKDVNWVRQHVLDTRYHGELIRFIEGNSLMNLPTSRLGVSFVVKPGEGLIHPVMHYGDHSESQFFIKFMKNLPIETTPLYLKEVPTARRYFFFLR